jgi:hypothetical protein
MSYCIPSDRHGTEAAIILLDGLGNRRDVLRPRHVVGRMIANRPRSPLLAGMLPASPRRDWIFARWSTRREMNTGSSLAASIAAAESTEQGKRASALEQAGLAAMSATSWTAAGGRSMPCRTAVRTSSTTTVFEVGLVPVDEPDLPLGQGFRDRQRATEPQILVLRSRSRAAMVRASHRTGRIGKGRKPRRG